MKQGQNVQFFYELHRNPPGLVGRYPDGTSYRSLLDGQTFFLLNGQYEIPVPGTPWPAQLFTANVMTWAFRNRKTIINFAFLIAVLVVTQFFLWQLPGDTMDEAKLSFIALLSFAQNGVLIFALCIVALTLLAWNFGRGVILQREKEGVLQLAAGQISILPDLLIMSSSADESGAAMADRIETARAGQIEGQWIVVLTFRHETGLVIFSSDSADGAEFDGYRFRRPEWGDAHMAGGFPDLSKGEFHISNAYKRETWNQYEAYCNQFAADFSAWSAEEKPRHIDPVKALVQRLRADAARVVSMLLILLLASGSAMCQKSARVADYLGQYRYDNAKPEGEVKFVFEKAVLKRAGHGDKTYRELLRDGVSYIDTDNMGGLLGITVKGQKISPESESPAKEKEVMVSKIATSETRPIPESWSMPDSVETEKKLDEIKGQVNTWKAKAWKAIRPFWAFIMWLFTSILAPFLVMLGGWMRYIAKSAAGEGAVNPYGGSVFGPFMLWVHQNFSASLMVIVWTAATILLFDSFMWLVWWGFSLWAIIPVWALELWLAQAATNWIVPNVRVVSAGFNGQQVNKFPQIG